MSVDKTKKRVSGLAAERQALQTAIADLEAQHADADERLDTLYAAAERTHSPAAVKAADKAEAEAQSLAGQLRRKRAALEACEQDLAAAREALEAAERAEQVAALAGMVDEAEALAGQLETNIDDVEGWARLYELYAEHRQMLAKVATDGHRFRELFEDPGRARQVAFALLKKRIDQRLGIVRGGLRETSIADELALDKARARLRSL